MAVAPNAQIEEDIPGHIADAVLRTMSKQPVARFNTASEFVAALA